VTRSLTQPLTRAVTTVKTRDSGVPGQIRETGLIGIFGELNVVNGPFFYTGLF